MALRIVIDKDYVLIENSKIVRPSRIARSDWMRYWEHRSTNGWLS